MFAWHCKYEYGRLVFVFVDVTFYPFCIHRSLVCDSQRMLTKKCFLNTKQDGKTHTRRSDYLRSALVYTWSLLSCCVFHSGVPVPVVWSDSSCETVYVVFCVSTDIRRYICSLEACPSSSVRITLFGVRVVISTGRWLEVAPVKEPFTTTEVEQDTSYRSKDR